MFIGNRGGKTLKLFAKKYQISQRGFKETIKYLSKNYNNFRAFRFLFFWDSQKFHHPRAFQNLIISKMAIDSFLDTFLRIRPTVEIFRNFK